MDDPNTARSNLRLRPRDRMRLGIQYSRIGPEINVNAELLFVQIGRNLAKVTLEL